MNDRRGRIGHKTREAIRFIKGQLSAGFATAVDWIVVSVLIFEHVFYVHAVVLGAVAGAISDFAVKKWWVFGTALKHSHLEVFRYALVSAISAVLNGGLVYLLVEGLHFAKAPSVVLASVIIGVLWNYPLHRLYVFAHTSTSPDET